eukprot:Seg1779.2 transcript_id=Seg1779.2/GoldUCD/mRNA.D3Y31 product="hypothetical protein" protein_id=Seg1779.2/GoldUCD/D3Y31
MRSPKARKSSPKKCKTGQAAGNIGNLKFNTYNSGGSISLPSKDTIIRVIEACDLRYYDHLALADEHKDSVLVIWQNEKGEAALRDNDCIFDYVKNKQLVLEIYFHDTDNRYRKILTITFHLTGKKNAVVVSGHASHEWIDIEFLFIKDLIQCKTSGKTKSFLLAKSVKESFPLKLITHPGRRGKMCTIAFDDDHDDDPTQKTITEKPNAQSSANKMVSSEFELSNHFQPLRNDDSFEIADSDMDLFSDTPQNSPIGDKGQLFHEFEILQQENAKLSLQNKFLQCQIDDVSAKLLAQEDTIQYLYKKVKNLGSPSNVEKDKTPQHQATDDGDNADQPNEGDGTHPQSGEDTEPNTATVIDEDGNNNAAENTTNTSVSNKKPWANVCKKYNMGICKHVKCRYQHKKVKTCRFYNSASGYSKGTDCNFLHIKSMMQQKPESNPLPSVNRDHGKDQVQYEQMRQQIDLSDNMLVSFLDKLKSMLINAVQSTTNNQRSDYRMQGPLKILFCIHDPQTHAVIWMVDVSYVFYDRTAYRPTHS